MTNILELSRHADGHLLVAALWRDEDGFIVGSQVIASGRDVADSVIRNRFATLCELARPDVEIVNAEEDA